MPPHPSSVASRSSLPRSGELVSNFLLQAQTSNSSLADGSVTSTMFPAVTQSPSTLERCANGLWASPGTWWVRPIEIARAGVDTGALHSANNVVACLVNVCQNGGTCFQEPPPPDRYRDRDRAARWPALLLTALPCALPVRSAAPCTVRARPDGPATRASPACGRSAAQRPPSSHRQWRPPTAPTRCALRV